MKIYIVDSDDDGIKQVELDADLCVISSLKDRQAGIDIHGQGTYEDVVSLIVSSLIGIADMQPECIRPDLYALIKQMIDEEVELIKKEE